MYRVLKHKHGAVTLGLQNANKIESNGSVIHRQVEISDKNDMTPFKGKETVKRRIT